jgi:hypothetical protein
LHWFPPEQAVQAIPPAPHAAVVLPGWQLPLASQQPLAQDVVSQTHAEPAHSCPEAHATQAAPSVPQYWVVVPDSHAVPLQQPLAQSLALQ